jgi:acyl carrier protein
MAYAAANAVADAIVLKRNQNGRGIWTTVDWDAWKFEQGRIDAVQAMLNTLDFSMNESEGAEVIALLLSMRATDQVIVSTGSLKARVNMWIEQHATLRSPAEMQSGQHKRPEVATPFAEPEGSIEKRLAAIWQEALGLDRVGRHDDFFEIGGHSLLAVTILAKTREAFGVDFPMDRVMEATRLSSAAAVIASLLGEPVEESAAAEPAPLAAPPTERRPVLIIGDDVYS